MLCSLLFSITVFSRVGEDNDRRKKNAKKSQAAINFPTMV